MRLDTPRACPEALEVGQAMGNDEDTLASDEEVRVVVHKVKE